MTETTRLLLGPYEVRKTKRQKAAFRRWLCDTLEDAGYKPSVEESRFAANVVAGDPESASLLLTAHYDTCAELPIPNFITPRGLVWYLLYNALIVVLIIGVAAFLSIALAMPFGLTRFVRIVLYMALILLMAWLMLAGPANPHTANDNTSGVATLLEVAHGLAPEDRERVCLVFFDNEEKGLLGSGAFIKRHPLARDAALVLNFDCVSDGDSIQFFPNRSLKADDALTLIETVFDETSAVGGAPWDGKRCEVVRGFGLYPSDNLSFKRGVGVCALKRSPVFGWYMNRIHTRRDRIFDEANIDLLCDGCLRLVSQLGA